MEKFPNNQNKREKKKQRSSYRDNTSPDVLAALASGEEKSGEWIDRRAEAYDPNTSPEILTKLASDTIIGVREAVAGNPNTPLDIVTNLTSDNDDSVCEAAEKNLKSRQK